jgi:dynein heavy chain 2, cytosolic
VTGQARRTTSLPRCWPPPGDPACLYLEDHHLADDAVLESVNSLLASGEVPGLYTHEELDPLLAPLKEQMGESAIAFRTPYDFFVVRFGVRSSEG